MTHELSPCVHLSSDLKACFTWQMFQCVCHTCKTLLRNAATRENIKLKKIQGGDFYLCAKKNKRTNEARQSIEGIASEDFNQLLLFQLKPCVSTMCGTEICPNGICSFIQRGFSGKL